MIIPQPTDELIAALERLVETQKQHDTRLENDAEFQDALHGAGTIGELCRNSVARDAVALHIVEGFIGQYKRYLTRR